MKKDTRSLIEALSYGPVRQYLTDHEHADLRQLILKNKQILGIPTAQLIEQISTRKKAREKLPLYYEHSGVVYPPTENFEQTSSQKTAVLKADLLANLLGEGTSGADLTGGFGVDAYFLSKKVQRLHFVEPSQSLLELAQYNHELLGVTNIVYHRTTAEEFVRSASDKFDFVYIDPSRRVSQKKVVAFEDATPDVIAIAPQILRWTNLLMIKSSPLLDLQAGISQIPSVEKVAVVSVSNECKEVLFISRRSFASTPSIDAIHLHGEGTDTFTFDFLEEKAAVVEWGEPSTYLYEPNASILKAGAFKLVGARHNLKKIHPNTHLYTGDHLIESFPGRKFVVEAFVRPDPAEVRKFLPDGFANVTTRNYPLSASDLKKKTRVSDGGEKYLIGFTGREKKFVAVARRV